MAELWLIRHGETVWSVSGAHTGTTDIPLTPAGEAQAAGIRTTLADRKFSLVLSSPLRRARKTCELAGFGNVMQIEPRLTEWNYGSYEGLTTPEIRKKIPGWSPFKDGFPGGELLEQVASRARAVIDRAVASDRAVATDGDVALFAHGHILRILTACWLGLPADAARLFALNPAGVSTLGYERETRVIQHWNR